jgi:hypothetical protein
MRVMNLMRGRRTVRIWGLEMEKGAWGNERCGADEVE